MSWLLVGVWSVVYAFFWLVDWDLMDGRELCVTGAMGGWREAQKFGLTRKVRQP
jgi:hypothetical protein